jgi:hypothetical protein
VDYVTRIAQLIREELDPETLPDGPIDDLLRLYAVLALALGQDVCAADVHDAWVAWMVRRDSAHEALVPFDDLDKGTAGEDAPFVIAIRAVAQAEQVGRGRPRN